MAENSKIEWCHHTFNPWIGCSKVSPGCDHCYAENLATRYKMAEWGPGKPRKLTSDANWLMPIKWNKQAQAAGTRYRVFCSSLADVFDNEVNDGWRWRLFALITQTPHLDWLLLTKRVGNIEKMLPPNWGRDGLPNVWLGISVVNQLEADRDIPKLLSIHAHRRFLSMEPLLGAVNLNNLDPEKYGRFNALSGVGVSRIDWVIVGGESGADARPLHPDWAKSLRDQCNAAGVPFLFKQWGEWLPFQQGVGYMRSKIHEARIIAPDGNPPNRNGTPVYNVGKKAAGRELDGREWNEYPQSVTL